jgi:excisionase family DNA binding protein
MVSERDAARLLGLSAVTVARLRKRGDIPAVIIGRAVRYAVADLQTWIAQQREVGALVDSMRREVTR